jgi:hypothetical protein
MDFKSHLDTIIEVLARLRSAGLTVNSEKVQICLSETKVLGHIISSAGVRPDPDKVAAMANYPRPRTVKDVRKFLGLTSWYRRFIKGYAHVVRPLNRLLELTHKWKWEEDCETAFNLLKQLITSSPIMAAPDFSKPFVVQTDASATGLGAMLFQESDVGKVIIQYASRSLSKTEQKYSTVERECLAILWAVEKFRPYVEGSKFKVVSDQRSLQWLKTARDPTGRLTRWSLRLQPYDFQIEYQTGKSNVVADALSRLPVSSQEIVSAIVQEVEVPDLQSISQAQQGDPCLGIVRDFLQQGTPFPNTRLGGVARRMVSRCQIRDDVLYRVFPTEKEGEVYRILLPFALRKKVIVCFHASLVGGHLGAFKTLSRIKQSYTWAGMTKDVSSYVRTCHKCQLHKSETVPPRGFMLYPKQLPQPWDTLAIDLAGPYPKSKSGNTFLLIIVDYLTKWPELFAIKRATSQAVATCLVKEVFPRFGIPRTIVSDNGRQFVANIFKTMCGMLGIRRKNTSFYHPQPNIAERNIKTIRSMITTSIRDSHREWDQNLPYLAMGLRSAVSESTGFSPAQLMFGRDIRLPSDPEIGTRSPVQPDPASWAVVVTRRVRDAISLAHTSIKAQRDKQKPIYDSKHRDVAFVEGELVLRRSHWLSDKEAHFMSKLAPRWQGPFRIFQVCSPVTYKLKDLTTGRVMKGTFHINELKPYVLEESEQLTVPTNNIVQDDIVASDSDDDVRQSNVRQLRPRGETQAVLRQAVAELKRR